MWRMSLPLPQITARQPEDILKSIRQPLFEEWTDVIPTEYLRLFKHRYSQFLSCVNEARGLCLTLVREWCLTLW